MVCDGIFDNHKWELRSVAQDYKEDADLIQCMMEMSQYLNSPETHVQEIVQTYKNFIEFCPEMNKAVENARKAGMEILDIIPLASSAQAVIQNLNLAFLSVAQRASAVQNSQS